MRNKTLAFLTLLISCLMTANSYAGKDGEFCEGKARHHHAKHSMPMHNKMIKRLDLSEEQQQQFKALHEQNRPKMQEQHAALRENHRQLHELIASGGYTEEKAARLTERHGQIAAELARLRTAEMAQLYALLTPEQQKEFANFEFKDHHGKDRRKD